MTCLLALDTATERMAVAVARGDEARCLNSEGGAAASLHLIPEALRLLAELGLAVADLDAVAFGQGPGAFTGLRTAVSVAQGLAYGAGKPVLAIDSLMIVAEDALAQAPWLESNAADPPGPRLWVLMDARMEQLYAAAYRRQGGQWQVDHAPALLDLADLPALWLSHAPAAVAGSALAAFGEKLALPLPASLLELAAPWPAPSPASSPAWLPAQQDRAAALLRLARAAWADGWGLPAEQALPVYLRDKVAQTTAERAAAKAGVLP